MSANKITITLTNRPPIRIVEDSWPFLVITSYKSHDNKYDFQANRTCDWHLSVRQHADGRAIVYAQFDYHTCYQGVRDAHLRAGVYIDHPATMQEIIDAIHHVAIDGTDLNDGSDVREIMIAECIADLPPVDVE